MIAEMRADIASDLHLEQAAYAKLPEMVGDSIFALQQIVRHAVGSGASLLILAGDVFNTNQPYTDTLQATFNLLNWARSEGVRIVYIEGQHEKTRGVPWLSLCPAAENLEKLGTLQWANLRIRGLSYRPVEELVGEIDNFTSGSDVFVCHQRWSEFMGIGVEGSLREMMPPSVKLVITGDFHTHCAKVIERPEGSFVVLSPGAMALQSISEDANKYFFTTDHGLKTESVPLRSRRVYVTPAATLAQLRDIAEDLVFREKAAADVGANDDLPKEIQKPLWVVRCPPEVDCTNLHAMTNDGFHIMVKRASSEALKAQEPLPGDASIGLMSSLDVMHREGLVTDKVYSLTTKVLRSADPAKAVDEYIQQVTQDWEDKDAAAKAARAKLVSTSSA